MLIGCYQQASSAQKNDESMLTKNSSFETRLGNLTSRRMNVLDVSPPPTILSNRETAVLFLFVLIALASIISSVSYLVCRILRSNVEAYDTEIDLELMKKSSITSSFQESAYTQKQKRHMARKSNRK